MKKLKNVVLMFDDGSEISMEAGIKKNAISAINFYLETKFPYNDIDFDFDWMEAERYTVVDWKFVISSTKIINDKDMNEFIQLARSVQSQYKPIRPLFDHLPSADEILD